MDDKSIQVPGYGELPFADMNPNRFLRYTTIMYGASQTGKSTLLKDILYRIKDEVPNIIIISTTNESNNMYTGMVPDQCILSNPTAEGIREILERQKITVSLYKKANNLDTLIKICDLINELNTSTRINFIRKKSQEKISMIESSNLNYGDKKGQVKLIEEVANKKITEICKECINRNKQDLMNKNLSDEFKTAIKYLNINPNICVVFEDCAHLVNEWAKDPSLCEVFFNGRHWYVTSIYTFQEAVKLPSELRKGTFNNFFTDANNAIGFFNNKTNAFTNQTKKNADVIAQFLFRPNPNGAPNFKKMVFNRTDQVSQLRYVVAEEIPDFRMGSKYLWELCNNIPKKDGKNQINNNSKFYKSFFS